MALFRIEDLKYRYRGGRDTAGSETAGSEAIDIPFLDFEEGRIYVLLGPNGSGKTTLLKLLNRLLRPASGAIFYRGSDIADNEELRRNSVYVHQNPLLFRGTVKKNVAYGLKLRKLRQEEIDVQVKHTLEIVNLSGFQKRKSTSLSAGEAQRVAIARALAVEPEVLLLDEPTSSIDKKNIGKLEDLLKSIRREYGCSIIISTHNLAFAYRMCDQLIKLEEGKVVATGENILGGRTREENSEHRVFRVGIPTPEPGSGGAEIRSGDPKLRKGDTETRTGEQAEELDIYSPDMEGDFTRAVIDYDRILLSTEPVRSSAQNQFSGEVRSIENCSPDGGLVDVSVEVAGHILTSRITGKSLRELSISHGSPVFVAFKASSVRLY